MTVQPLGGLRKERKQLKRCEHPNVTVRTDLGSRGAILHCDDCRHSASVSRAQMTGGTVDAMGEARRMLHAIRRRQ